MDIEQCKEIYEALKKGKDFIANIDKDFFLNFAEIFLSELEKKDKVINEMAKTINKEYYKDIIENYTKKVEKEGIKE